MNLTARVGGLMLSDGADGGGRAEHADTPLSSFLSSEFPLPPSAIAGLHSLTLLPTPPEQTPLRAAVDALAAHVASVGRIPDIRSAAALTIAYGGSAELCQVWSRSAAVAGGLNVLARGVASARPSDSDPAKVAVTLTNGEAVTASWLLSAAPAPPASARGAATTLAKGIYVVTDPLDMLFARKTDADRIVPNAAVLTFPAGSLSLAAGAGGGGDRDGDRDGGGTANTNAAPVYVIAHSASTGECLQGEGECPPYLHNAVHG